MSLEDTPARGSPADWLQHARSDLCLAQSRPDDEAILLETLCFHAQQAAEKAIKAVLVLSDVEFPRTHNIGTLVELLPADVARDPALDDATILTEYAVSSRYPGVWEAVTEDEFQNALAMAASIVVWAEVMIAPAS